MDVCRFCYVFVCVCPNGKLGLVNFCCSSDWNSSICYFRIFGILVMSFDINKYNGHGGLNQEYLDILDLYIFDVEFSGLLNVWLKEKNIIGWNDYLRFESEQAFLAFRIKYGI